MGFATSAGDIFLLCKTFFSLRQGDLISKSCLSIVFSVCPKFSDFVKSEALRVKHMGAGDTYLRFHDKSICFYIKTKSKLKSTLISQDMSVDELLEAFRTPLKLPAYPNNTQAVERMVWVVTEVAPLKAGYTARHRYSYYSFQLIFLF